MISAAAFRPSGITNLFKTNHNPIVSPKIKTKREKRIYAFTAEENVRYNLVLLLWPISKAKKREVAPANPLLKKVKIVIMPATTWNTPKSVTPNTSSITLDVYRETTRLNSMRAYRNSVFLAIVLFEEIISAIRFF
ncbi:hypothetical protein [Alloprevotella tannerae]|uniref:hypothetical protein n=1 Tax=Alloprevotella tannerae TaxID=76122 RepID=UPI0028E516FA|nr:hypothetical protein [Alloprevotella tannerae]